MLASEKNIPSWPDERNIMMRVIRRRDFVVYTLFALVAVLGLLLAWMTPVREIAVTKLVIHDPVAGTFSRPTDFNPSEYYGDDKITKQGIFEYVVARHRYDASKWSDDYVKVQLFSGLEEQKRYIQETKLSEHPRQKLKKGNVREISIISMLPLSANQVQVRFLTRDKVERSGVYSEPKYWVAIVDYEYKEEAIQQYEDQANILGFIVTNYEYEEEGIN